MMLLMVLRSTLNLKKKNSLKHEGLKAPILLLSVGCSQFVGGG
jgi:hypothetical protein